jgi:3D (Asp-Asp-Asp) domain-containing protein
VPRPGPQPSRLAALLALTIVAVAVPVSGGANPSTGAARRAGDLRAQNATLTARAHSALLGLYGLDSRLARTQARLASLHARAEALRRQSAQLRRQLDIARIAWTVSQRRLMAHLRLLYEQGETDPVAVLLGARSLDEAITSIEDVNRAADLNRAIVGQTSAARVALRATLRKVAARSAAAERLEASARTTAAAFARERGERAAYLASVVRQRNLNARQLAALEAAAARAEARATKVAAVRAVEPAPEADPAMPGLAGGSIAVVATGYSRQGRTATGVPAGWGVVAVDPSVIPLGTRLTIPGYGSGVAADIGSSIRGAAIDLWFPTSAGALAWGRRSILVTLG